MDKSLYKIVSNGYSIADSVNTNLLKQHTRQVHFESLSTFQWNKLRCLHILGCSKYVIDKSTSDRRRSELGCFISKDDTWLLIIGAPREQIMGYVSRCSENLEHLTVRFTTLTTLSIGHLTNLKWLNLSSNIRLNQLKGLHMLRLLQQLDVSHTAIGPKFDLNRNIGLETLNISKTSICTIGLTSPLPSLRTLSATGSQLADSAFLRYLPGLQMLDIDSTPITDLESLSFCTELDSLYARNTGLIGFPSLETHTKLNTISLAGTPITDLDHVQFPPNLEGIYLNRTNLRQIPAGLRSLKKLSHLGLSKLTLDTLPSWLPELGLRIHRGSVGWGIDLRDTTVHGVDMSIFDQSQEIILQWFEERYQLNAPVQKEIGYDHGSSLNELKVVFLGDGGAGKSYTIARLLADGRQPKNFSGDSTPGIVITDKPYRIDERDVQIHFWDFGGQEILHSMHRMFLTDRTLYVVVLNVRDGTQDDRARYWLHNIKSFAGNAPVLVVLNQMDENPNASINENDLRRMAPGMTETVKMSALKFSPEEFNNVFTAALLRQIGRMSGTLDFFFPAAWTKVKRSLQTMENHYIHGDDYSAICEECGVRDEGDLRKGLLKWFNDLGVSFCYGGDVRLEDYVILRPDWLTNAIYIILFNKLENVRNGIVPLQTIYKILKPETADQERIRRVLPDVSYDATEVSYVLNVIRKFRLSFAVNNDEEFIPMLCNRNSLPIAAEYEEDPATLEFRMEYEYLPNNVLHRLMVQLRGHLDTDSVWLTGARFRQESTGLSAVVKTEGNDLKIFVRSTNRMHPANTYLSFIKDELDRINRDMGLARPYNLMVYKADGISEEFDYDDLINALADGETTYRSRIRRKRIPIESILIQTGHTADETREQLIQDLLSTCISMQNQKLYWHLPDDERSSKENIRNDYVRELLRSRKYHISDQSRNGISGGGIQAGLLDLDIRQHPDIPWTIYEALNISGIADRANWNTHLQKLLDNYNPNGLHFLFLVSYLECSRDDFPGIAAAYDEHMRWHEPKNYERLSSSFACVPVEHAQYIRMTKCTYDRSGVPTTVYHILVRLGN